VKSGTDRVLLGAGDWRDHAKARWHLRNGNPTEDMARSRAFYEGVPGLAKAYDQSGKFNKLKQC